LSTYVHRPVKPQKVSIVGFVPAVAKIGRSDDDFTVSSSIELEESSSVHSTPTWSTPETAWYLKYLTATPSKHAEVVARLGHNGQLALAGTIQAHAPR